MSDKDLQTQSERLFEPNEQQPKPDDSLEQTANLEHEYLRNRLRNEFQREPTEGEMNEWLRQHTEGY